MIYQKLLSALSEPESVPQYLLTNYYLWRYSKQVEMVYNLRQNDEWLLVVLDACRYDRFMNIYPEFLEADVIPITSAGKNTFDYLRKNWPDEYGFPYITAAAPVTSKEFDFSEADVSANGLAISGDELRSVYQGYVPANHLHNIVEVWQQHWDEDLGVCPPEPVTDVALSYAKGTNQMVVHYFQPHAPYIGKKQELANKESVDTKSLEGGAISQGIWDRIKEDDITRDELMSLYDENLRRVLKEVVYLIDQVEFENVVVMGDHGEALGEYGKYAHLHPYHPKVRLVPWATITEINTSMIQERGEYQYERQITNQQTEDRLHQLGYL